MSRSTTSYDIDPVIQYFISSNYYAAAIVVLIFYELVLTSSSVIGMLSHNRGISTILISANNLNLMGLAITNLLFLVPWTSLVTCQVVPVFLTAFELISIVINAAVSALRVYAVSSRNRLLTALTLSLGLVPEGTNLFLVASTKIRLADGSSRPTCEVVGGESATLRARLAPTSRACTIACDGVAMAATWYYLYYHNGGQRVIRGSPFKLTPALPDLLLRDGTIYFLAIVLLNVTDIALFTSGNGLADVAVLIFPITSVLISRLLLHLRKATSSGIVFSSETPSFVRTRDALPSSEHLPPITYAMHHLRKGATVDPDWDTDTVMYAQNSPWDNDIEMRPIGARRNGGRDVVDCDDSTAPSADTKSRTGSLSHPRGRSPVRVSFHIE